MNSQRLLSLPLLASGLILPLLSASHAHAQAQERFFGTAEVGFALPLNDPHSDAYGFGAEAGLGIFRSFGPKLALGLRASYGALAEEEEAGIGGYNFGVLTGVLRLRPLGDPNSSERATGFWIEGGAGPGRVEDETRFVITPALGYTFAAGEIGVGPFARYLQVVEPDFDDGRIGVLGIEVVLFDGRDRNGAGPPAAAPAEPLPDTDEPPAAERRSRFVNDRLELDEEVFFAYDQAELRPEGKKELDSIAQEYKDDGGNWAALKVQGHADERGPEPYNEKLSRRRAAAVKEYLASQGVPAEKLDVEAYGERRPEVPNADTRAEHQKNRRVEFVIVRAK
jgi:OOP family OmpA-OmpF porin